MHDGTFSTALTHLPLFDAAWVFWLLVLLSVVSVAVALERVLFFRARRVDIETLVAQIRSTTDAELRELGSGLAGDDSLEHAVLSVALEHFARGRAAIGHAASSRLTRERARYEQRLIVLATVAANAPFVGLFGTVLGVIRAFRDLSTNVADASSAVMAGVAEALVSTAVGLLVAIPAVVAYNALKSHVKRATQNATSLTDDLRARASAP